jgi:hypothetical protein
MKVLSELLKYQHFDPFVTSCNPMFVKFNYSRFEFEAAVFNGFEYFDESILPDQFNGLD